MKKLLTAITLCLLLTLTACSSNKPNGKYGDDYGYIVLVFNNDRVTFTSSSGNTFGGSFKMDGTDVVITWDDGSGVSTFGFDKKADCLTYESITLKKLN